MTESVLLVGSAGREHALAEGMAASEQLDAIYCAPGNAGTEQTAKVENIPIGTGNIDGLARFARERQDNSERLTVVVGPEAPLVAGLGDRLRADGIAVLGASTAAVKLEASKIFATAFMSRPDVNIPQPKSHVARSGPEAARIINGRDPSSLVIKADGLAGGKGVVLPDTYQELTDTLVGMLGGELFDGAGKTGVVIQERLHGPELSVFVMSDGVNYSIIPAFAQDHKRLQDGDRGPNTGGMGAYAPVPDEMLSSRQRQQVEYIANQAITGMAADGAPYQGVLYMGLMLAEERGGDPVVIEFNARFGDPEAQVLVPLLTDSGVDVYEMIRDTARGQAPDFSQMRTAGRGALTVCLAASGYPDVPAKGQAILGLEQNYPNAHVFHGGTKRQGNHIETAGGRVLYVTGRGETVDAAAAAAYAAIGEQAIHFPGMQYRTDIGWQARSNYAARAK